MRIIAVLSLLIMVGCADEAISPPPPFALVFDEAASEEQVTSVMEAAAAWNAHLGAEVFYRADQHEGHGISDVTVVFSSEGLIPLSPGADANSLASAVRESQYSPWTVTYTTGILWDQSTLQHELGHVLGIVEHSKDPNSVMWESYAPQAVQITAQDVEQVRQLWDL